MSVEQRQGARVRVLDLRSSLSSGGQALAEVRAAAEALVEQGVLELHSANEPGGWLAELGRGDFVVTSSVQADGNWLSRIAKGRLVPLEDLSQLEPPGPLERVLLALARLKPGDVFLGLLPRYPTPLLPVLDARGANYELALRADGTALLWLSLSDR